MTRIGYLPLFALVPALAVRRAGARLAAPLVLSAVALSILAQLLTVARYYG